MMILCAGASSRRVVEEAARLKVHQIVASRRQVGEFEPGYTGLDSRVLVTLVKKLSGGETNVVRDHGGPHQNGEANDNWTMALDADLDAGFNGLHIDVCKLPQIDQVTELKRLCRRYSGKARIEVGGERDNQDWLDVLVSAAQEACHVSAAVADLGGNIWADRQRGALLPRERAQNIASRYAAKGVVLKAHNMDWVGGRQDYKLAALYNIAPELGNVEVDAWLRVLSYQDAHALLLCAYTTRAWERWFLEHEGTRFERSRCALRYHLETPEFRRVLDRYDDTPVREAIRDAIQHG